MMRPKILALLVSVVSLVSGIRNYAIRRIPKNDITDSSDEFGGHSREFNKAEEFNFPAWYDLEQYGHSALSRYVATHQRTFQELMTILKRTFLAKSVRVAVQVRIKTLPSIKHKLMNKNLKEIHDILGVRLTVQTIHEVLRLKDLVSSIPKIKLLKTVCYGVCSKEKEKYKPKTGYRRIHLVGYLKGVQPRRYFEIQLSTPYMSFFADWAHDLTYKPHDTSIPLANNTQVNEYQMKLSNYFLDLDILRNKMPKCPEAAKETKALSYMEMDIFVRMAFPPNACFWWPDIWSPTLPNND